MGFLLVVFYLYFLSIKGKGGGSSGHHIKGKMGEIL
jgi:hypothetical protein